MTKCIYRKPLIKVIPISPYVMDSASGDIQYTTNGIRINMASSHQEMDASEAAAKSAPSIWDDWSD